MGGGLFQHLSTVLADAVMSELPGAVPIRTALPPVVGALAAVGADPRSVPGSAIPVWVRLAARGDGDHLGQQFVVGGQARGDDVHEEGVETVHADEVLELATALRRCARYLVLGH